MKNPRGFKNAKEWWEAHKEQEQKEMIKEYGPLSKEDIFQEVLEDVFGFIENAYEKEGENWEEFLDVGI